MPLSVWFWGAYLVTTQTPGQSALQFQRQLGLKRYETAFQMLHKLRAGLVRPERDTIGDQYPVEVDKSFVGGRTKGEGRGVHHKAIVIGAIEVRPRKAPVKGARRTFYAGRLRLRLVPNREAKSLTKFVRENVAKGAVVHTDGWTGYDRALFQKLAEGNWIEAHDNLALTGPTGTGKSWLSSALGHKACRDNRSVLYHRVPKLFEHLALARGDGRHPRILRSLGRADLLILDDWGLEPLDAAARHDLLEILEERYGRRSTVITSQLPVDRWHEIIGDPTYADAILDRLVHNAHRIELAGESIRRTRGKQNQKA